MCECVLLLESQLRFAVQYYVRDPRVGLLTRVLAVQQRLVPSSSRAQRLLLVQDV